MQYIYAETIAIDYIDDSYWEGYETDIHIWPNNMDFTYKQGRAELLFIWEV